MNDPKVAKALLRLELEMIHFRQTNRGSQFLVKALNNALSVMTGTTTKFRIR